MANKEQSLNINLPKSDLLVPHNLAPEEVKSIINGTQGEICIFMLKPDTYIRQIQYDDQAIYLQRLIEGLINAVNLKCICTSQKRLNETQVYNLYEKVLKPNPKDDEIWGTQWKNEVIHHLTDKDVFSYLLTGDEALKKAKIIKRTLRRVLVIKENVVKNIAHVPDEEEFNLALNVLFL